MARYVGISTVNYDPGGARAILMLNHPGDARTGARRANRTATLTGGCVVYDTGYADADRTVVVETEDTTANVEWIEYIVRAYRIVRVALEDGVYLAIPARHSVRNGRAVIELEITEKLT